MPLSWAERVYEFFAGECKNNALRLRCLCADLATAIDSSDARREQKIECEFFENMVRKVESNDIREVAIGIQGLNQMESASPNHPLLRRLTASVHKRRISFASANLSRLNLSRVNSGNTNIGFNTMSSSYATSISSRAPSVVNVPRRAIKGCGLASIQEVAHPVMRKGPSRPATDFIQLLHGDNRTINGKCPRWITHEGTIWEGYYEVGEECELYHVSDNLPNAPGYEPEVIENLYPIVKKACIGEHNYIYHAASTKHERVAHALTCMGGISDLLCHLLGPDQTITGYDGITYHDVMRYKHEEDFPKGTVQEPVTEHSQGSSQPNIVRGFKLETSQQKEQRLDKVVHATPWNANEKWTSRVDLIYEHYTKPHKTRFVSPTKLDVLDVYNEFDYDDLETEQTSRMCIPGWTKAIEARAIQAPQGEITKARAIQAQQRLSSGSVPAHPIMRLVSLPAAPYLKHRKVTVHTFSKPASQIDIIKAALKESHAATKLKNGQPLKVPMTKPQSSSEPAPAKLALTASPLAKPLADLYAKSLTKVPLVFASGAPPKCLTAGVFRPPHLPDVAVTAKILRQPGPATTQDLPPPNPDRPLRRVLTQHNLDPKRHRVSNLSVVKPVTNATANATTTPATKPAAKPAAKPTNSRRKSGGVQFALDLPPKEREAQAAKQNQEEQKCQMRAARDLVEREIQRAAKKRIKQFRVAEANALKLKRAQGGTAMSISSGMAMAMPSGMATANTSGSTTPKAKPLANDDEQHTPKASVLNRHLGLHDTQVAMMFDMEIPDLGIGHSKLKPEDLPEQAVESDDEDLMKVEMSRG